jgi:single-strand DNA-binding protein
MKNMRNYVQLIGSVHSPVNLKKSINGKTYARFNMCTCDYYKEAGRRIIDKQIHRVVVWGRLAEEIARYLEFGDEVVIDGSINKYQFADKQITEVLASSILFPNKKQIA